MKLTSLELRDIKALRPGLEGSFDEVDSIRSIEQNIHDHVRNAGPERQASKYSLFDVLSGLNFSSWAVCLSIIWETRYPLIRTGRPECLLYLMEEKIHCLEV